MRSRLLGFAPLLLGLLGLWVFGRVVDQHDAVSGWLLWRYLRVIAAAVVWAAACLAGGFALLDVLKPGVRALREKLVVSFALGVLAWAVLTFVVGLFHGLNVGWFIATPVLGFIVGGRRLVTTLRRAWRLLKRLPTRRAPLLSWLAASFGLSCVLFLYVCILTPRNLTYDARWFHQGAAEGYAAAGAIFPFQEGWLVGTFPHLASWLYTWAYALPFGRLFDQIELAAHLEFALFLATLASAPVLIDRLLPRPRLSGSWAARFLFPGVLLYDSAPGGGSDHVLAFWSVPLFLSLAIFWKRPTIRSATLVGVLIGAAVMTRYQALYLVAGPLIGVGVRFMASLVNAQRRAFVKPALTIAAATLVTASPHWASGLVWHHNPVYPYLSKVFPSRPMAEGVDPRVEEAAWLPKGTTREKISETLTATARFGFEAHDWSTFHGNRPVFGSLFLIAMALVPFAFRRRKLLALGLSAWLAVPIWYWTHHQDRYLQAVATWFAIFVVVSFAGVWRRFAWARPALVGCVAFQLFHVADIVSLPAHAMLHKHPLFDVFELIASSDPAAPDTWVDQSYTFSRADPLLPKDAKVLVHETHLHLGLRRPGCMITSSAKAASRTIRSVTPARWSSSSGRTA